MRGSIAGRLLLSIVAVFVLGLALLFLIAFGSIKTGAEAETKASAPVNRKNASALRYQSIDVGRPLREGEQPWISNVNLADLDGDGNLEILACDGKENQVIGLWRDATGEFLERVLATQIPAPAHVQGDDFDQDGDVDLLVASMGAIMPNNDLIGAVYFLENTGSASFVPHVLIEGIARVTDVRAGDFNEDGLRDLVVGQFGYFQGEIRWMENLGDGRFASTVLLSYPGTIHTPVGDFNRDGHLDFAALVTQEFENVYLFFGDGSGGFRKEIVWGATNEDYGGSGMIAVDMDRDGWLDLVVTNGDGFDYATPGPRAWHGVQWLKNNGGSRFTHHRVGRMRGAYSPVAVDLNRDGLLDVVACSGFNDWTDPSAVSLRAFINQGRQQFTPVDLTQKPTHLMTVVGGDLDQDGVPELVTGGFHAYPPWDSMSRLRVWSRKNQ